MGREEAEKAEAVAEGKAEARAEAQGTVARAEGVRAVGA